MTGARVERPGGGHAGLRGIVATRYELPDAEHASLRTIVGAIERTMSKLPGPKAAGEGEAVEVLRAAFAELTLLLALGPASAVRSCPRCGHMAMCAATLCGHCWTRLPPGAA